MKQSVAKSLGVAALGAAFAAAGAGAANAAPAVADPAAALGPVSSVVPAAGATESLTAGQNALGTGLNAAKPVLENVASPKPGGPTSPVSGLIGGLPLGGSGVNGLPLG
ncbi:ATP-binding protein [Streptomyces sp. NPDC004732]|uniref:ATP-binding protein n=1 Tax=Streptomyces sp. NPDC004732 TaxID=3154290 RepID=UPI0033A433E7